MKGVLLSVAVGGLAGLGLGERDLTRSADPWLAEAIQGLRSGDLMRADRAVYWRLMSAPTDAAALVLQERVQVELACERAMKTAEHALVNGDRATATVAYESVKVACRQHVFARTRLEQIGAR